MSAIVFLIEQTALGLYIFIGVGAFLALLSIRRAGREYRATQYELERELLRFRSSNALTALALLAEAALIILGVQRIVAPTLRGYIDAEALVQTVAISDGTFAPPTPPPAGTPFSVDASGVVINPDLLVQAVLATPTLTPTPVGTLLPNPPDVVGCDTPNASLQIPANGMVVFETITVRGVATVENFAFYRLEINGEALGNFAVLSQNTVPVGELGELAQFIPSVFDPGEYQFRLTVFDITNTVRAACMITIFITDPPPTATPLGTALPPAPTVAGAGN
jgi:hypothetical protein